MKFELKLYYNSKYPNDRQTLAYAKSINKFIINEFDISKVKLSETQLTQLADRLKIEVTDLMFNENRYEFSKEDTLKAIRSNMDLLKTPIFSSQYEATFIGSSYDLIKVGMAMDKIVSSNANSGEN